jgi:Transmembrane secretion effector
VAVTDIVTVDGRDPGQPAEPPVVVRSGGGGWPDFRLIWAAHSVSTFGDHLTLVALPLATFARTGSALAVGIAAAMEAVTVILFGMLAGVLGDRLRHRHVLVATDAFRALILVALALALTLPGYPVAVIYLAAFGLGLLRVLHDSAAGAVIPVVVENADLLKANSRMQASESVATAVGPAVAGVLISAFGPAAAFFADAGSFAVSGGAVRRVRRLDRIHANRGPVGPSLRREMGAGMRALVADKWVMRATLLAAAVNVLAIAVEAQFIPYAHDVLHVGGVGVGVYFALLGASAVATSIAVGRYQLARGDVLVGAVAIYASGILLAGLHPTLVTAGLAHIGAGVGSALFATHYYSLRQRRFPVSLQGRVVVATRMIMFGVVPIAYVAGGLLANHLGPQALFVGASCVGLAAMSWAALAGLGRLRVD